MTAGDGQAPGRVIAAPATVVLDVRALDEPGPATLDRLAQLAERQAMGKAPLLGAAQAESTDIRIHNPRGAL